MTSCTYDRQLIFRDASLVEHLTLLLQQTCTEKGFAVLAYVFMPDHLHLLVEGATPQSHFRSFMTLFLQRTAVWTKAAARLRLWQDGYYERVLRPDDEVTEVVAYILENPVRKGLVTRPADYPFLHPREAIVTRD